MDYNSDSLLTDILSRILYFLLRHLIFSNDVCRYRCVFEYARRKSNKIVIDLKPSLGHAVTSRYVASIVMFVHRVLLLSIMLAHKESFSQILLYCNSYSKTG